MAIFVPRWQDFGWQVRLQMCRKFCMVKIADCMRSPSVQYDIFGAAARRTVERQHFAELGAFELI
jgi:hypothetical protein